MSAEPGSHSVSGAGMVTVPRTALFSFNPFALSVNSFLVFYHCEESDLLSFSITTRAYISFLYFFLLIENNNFVEGDKILYAAVE